MIYANGTEFDSLKQILAWANATMPDKIVIDIIGPHKMAYGINWDYFAPAGIVMRGINGGALLCKTNGWIFGFKPVCNGNERGSAILFESLEFSGGGKGAVNIAPNIGGDQNAGGESGWLDKVEFKSCNFNNIGSSLCVEQLVGYAAIYAQGVRELKVDGCYFKNIVNKPCKLRHEAWMHAVYCVDNTQAIINNCVFRRVSGDPIRVRDGAFALVTNSWSISSGQNAMASSWRQPNEKPGSAKFKNNVITKGFKGQQIREWQVIR